MKDEVLLDLEELYKVLKEINTELKKNDATFIGQAGFKEKIKATCKTWFNNIKNPLTQIGISNDIDKYSSYFIGLAKLSNNYSRTSSYKTLVFNLLKDFSDELILPLQTLVPTSLKGTSNSKLILAKVKDPEENNYLKEALACLENNFLKAAIVLGWCAAISRIHKLLEQKGFQTFNDTSLNLTNQISGRFKRFSKKFNINSLSELQEIFDSDILWILEGMNLIDSNQHTRLKSCFDMRCHSAHPGEAPITEFNCLSFFSDLVEIVLNNNKFAIKPHAKA
jgi:hypothetical protein